MVERFTRLFRLVNKSLNPKTSVEQPSMLAADVLKKSKEETIEPVPLKTEQKQPITKRTTIIDSKTGKVVEDEPSDVKTDPQSLVIVQRQLPPNLPGDITKLAAQNKAFFQGITALQRMNLDEDLFQEAVEDLKKKYYKERSSK